MVVRDGWGWGNVWVRSCGKPVVGQVFDSVWSEWVDDVALVRMC